MGGGLPTQVMGKFIVVFVLIFHRAGQASFFLCLCLSEKKQLYFFLIIIWNVTICISVCSVHEFCNINQPKNTSLSFWRQRHRAKPYFSSSPLHLPCGKYCGREIPSKARCELFSKFKHALKRSTTLFSKNIEEFDSLVERNEAVCTIDAVWK